MKQFVFILLISSLSCAAQVKWSLDQCIDYALVHHTQIKRQQENLQLAEDIYRQSKYEMLPSINAEYSHTLTSGKSFNENSNLWEKAQVKQGDLQLVSEITLFSGGYVRHLIKQNEYIRRKSTNALEQLKNETSLSVLQAYTKVLFYKENLALSQKQQTLLDEQYAHIKILIDKGVKNEIDLLEIEARIEKEKTKTDEASNNYTLALLTLKEEMGYPKTNEMMIQEPYIEDLLTYPLPVADSLYITALHVLPDLDMYSNEIKSLYHTLGTIRSNYYPSVKIRGYINSDYIVNAFNEADPYSNYSYYDQLNNNLNNQLMLVISFPLFNKNQIKRKQLESVYEIKDANLRKDEMKNKLLVEVEKICENAQMIRDNYVSEKETVRLYNEILELRKTQYNLGVITFLDYITAKNNLEATEIELLKSKYNLFFYTRLINFYSGYGIHQDVYQR